MKRYISLFLIICCVWIIRCDAIQTGGPGASNEEKLTGKLSIADSATTPPLNLTERSSAPSSPATGDIYLDDGSNTASGEPGLRRYTGSGWEDLSSRDSGKRVVILKPIAEDATLSTGDGIMCFVIPALIDGMNLVDVDAHVFTASSSGTPTIQIYNATDSQDMLSTAITIDANEKDSKDAATPPVVNTSYDDVVEGDEIRVDVDVAGTGTEGLEVRLAFQKP